MLKLNKYFKGYYYKNQKGKNTISFIQGKSSDSNFIQVITNDFSCNVPYTCGNFFSPTGIKININHEKISILGELSYYDLTPIEYDIMGIFKYFPMECRHEIVSMHHKINGGLLLNGEYIDFSGGNGYIEGDSGTSFPEKYMWIQCNDFPIKCSIVVSVAIIKLGLLKFNGCICNINYVGDEYRMATYLGVRIIECSKNRVILKQGKYRLEINISSGSFYELAAPDKGQMKRTITEAISCKAEFKFFIKDMMLFNFKSENASFEYVM